MLLTQLQQDTKGSIMDISLLKETMTTTKNKQQQQEHKYDGIIMKTLS